MHMYQESLSSVPYNIMLGFPCVVSNDTYIQHTGTVRWTAEGPGPISPDGHFLLLGLRVLFTLLVGFLVSREA